MVISSSLISTPVTEVTIQTLIVSDTPLTVSVTVMVK